MRTLLVPLLALCCGACADDPPARNEYAVTAKVPRATLRIGAGPPRPLPASFTLEELAAAADPELTEIARATTDLLTLMDDVPDESAAESPHYAAHRRDRGFVYQHVIRHRADGSLAVLVRVVEPEEKAFGTRLEVRDADGVPLELEWAHTDWGRRSNDHAWNFRSRE